MGLLRDAAGEADDREAFVFCAACDAKGGLSLQGLSIDGAFAGDDEVASVESRVETRYLQKIVDPVDQPCVEECLQGCGHSARRAAGWDAGQVCPRLPAGNVGQVSE